MKATKQELADALKLMLDLYALDDEGQPMIRWFGAETIAERVKIGNEVLRRFKPEKK